MIYLIIQSCLLVIFVTMVVRSEIVFRVRRRVSEWVFADVPGEDWWKWTKRYRRMEEVLGTYGHMMLDLRKWTYKSFTKGLFD